MLRLEVLSGLRPPPPALGARDSCRSPSPTLVEAPLFGPRCFLVLLKVPPAPEAAVNPATRPQALEPSANGTPLSQRPWLTRSRRAREVDEGHVSRPSWRALLLSVRTLPPARDQICVHVSLQSASSYRHRCESCLPTQQCVSWTLLTS